jgi:hypothetical protein
MRSKHSQYGGQPPGQSGSTADSANLQSESAKRKNANHLPYLIFA